MKKVFLWVITIVFTMVLFTYSSCGSVSEEDFYGVWRIDEAEIENLDDLADQFAIDLEMNDEEKEEFKEELEIGLSDEFIGETFEFFNDKTLELSGNEAEWELNSDNKTITITEGSDQFDFVINKMQDNKLDANLIIKDNDYEIIISMILVRE